VPALPARHVPRDGGSGLDADPVDTEPKRTPKVCEVEGTGVVARDATTVDVPDEVETGDEARVPKADVETRLLGECGDPAPLSFPPWLVPFQAPARQRTFPEEYQENRPLTEEDLRQHQYHAQSPSRR